MNPVWRLLITLLLVPWRAAAAQADTAWRYAAGSDIQRVRDCAAAELLVFTKNSLLAVDASAGTKLWERTDLPSLGWGLYLPCEGKTAVSYRGDKIVAFDVVSGQQRWDATALPTFSEIRGTAVIASLDLVLLFLRTATSDRSVAALRISSGERLWQRDDLFQVPPAFAVHDGVSDIDKFQVFVASGDTSLMMYLSLDGPMAIDLRSGAALWPTPSTRQALAGQPVPSLDDYAGMRLVDSTLVIPRDKGLVGVDARSGQVRWQRDTLLPRRATFLAAVAAEGGGGGVSGIMVRAGIDYVDVLDPATGTSRWPRPLTLRADAGASAVVENRYYFVSRDQFMVADLATGHTTAGEKLRFRDNEWAGGVFPEGDGFVVMSRQNLFRVDARGALRYQRFYNAPGTSLLQQMGGMYGNYGSAKVTGRHAYFVTNQPDAAGKKGNSLLRVALDDGSDAGRIWLREKAPAYWPDGARNQVLMLADDKTLVAIRFSATPQP